MRNSILIHGALCCFLYILFILLMKLINLMHITELRMVNYVILCIVCLYQIKKWVNKGGGYVPFLQVFSTVFFTGIWSFFLFSIFLFIFSKFNTELSELFIRYTPESLQAIPPVIILFEGSAISIIVAFINVQYFRRYEEGNVQPKK